jgi:hypothetical protein
VPSFPLHSSPLHTSPTNGRAPLPPSYLTQPGYFPDPGTKVCKNCDYKKNCRICASATACNICAEVGYRGWRGGVGERAHKKRRGARACGDPRREKYYRSHTTPLLLLHPPSLVLSSPSSPSVPPCKGHFLHADGSCRRCKSGCMECEDGYAGPGTLTPRHAPHRHCIRCMQGLYPDPSSKASGSTGPGSCMAPIVANCLQPYEKDAKKCAVCDDGFSKGQNSTACIPCKAGCLKCADGDSGTNSCLQCTQNLYPDLTNPGACIATAVSNCLQASNGDAAKCVVCAPGHALLASGQCAS